MPRRLLLHGPEGTWSLEPGSWLVGRGEQCRIRVSDPRLSRTHARIIVDPGQPAMIEDLGGNGGVLVQHERIRRPTVLADGDTVVCGPLLLTVSLEEPAHATPILEAEPPTPPPCRRATEEMTPLPTMAKPASSGSRPVDHAIAAAVRASSGSHPAAGPDTSHQALTRTSQERGATTPAPVFDRRASDVLLPNDDDRGGSSGSALVPGESPMPASPRLRIAAGLLDGGSALVATATLGIPVLVAGWIAALLQAGVLMDRSGLPLLFPEGRAGAGELLASLFRPGGPDRAWDLVRALHDLPDRQPFLLVFVAAAMALLVALLVLLLGLVAPSVSDGGPRWHRRLGIKLVVARNGHHPGWLRALLRWLLLAATWPVALPWALAGRRSPHDLASGCQLRRG